MYLAIKEILKNKLRYSLILTTIFLIAFMVFFMTSLALGLVRNNRAAVDNWQATGVVLSDYANDNLTASFIPEKNYKDQVSEDAAPLGYMFAVTNLVNDSEKVNISIFAQDWDSFISPSLIEGHYPESDNEVVVDQSLENYGIKLGDVIQLNGSENSYTIVGLTKGNKFFTEPVVFTNLTSYWSLQGSLNAGRSISALGYQGDNTGENISQLNPYYCELTGLYWAWKNLDCDYLGLVHYRRYFTKKTQFYKENLKIDEVILNQEEIELLLRKGDIIVPKKRKYYIETLYSHYAHTLDASHLDLARKVIEKQQPEYLDSFDKVMKQRSGYMFNMFIMKKELANNYFEWLFPILDCMFDQIDLSELTAFEARLFGRVSELLFNVWLQKNSYLPVEAPFMYLEKVNIIEKGKSFLMAKFFGKKYGQSF